MVNFTYKYNDNEEAKKLTPMMEQKLIILQKFIDDGSSVLCEVEFEKVAPQSSGDIYRVEVNATIDGTMYRAEAIESNFEKAIDEVRNELDKELRRAKGKRKSRFMKAARKIKSNFTRR